jgi:putative peptidoglycan lipid II flippase
VALRCPETREIVRRMLPVAGGLAATQVCILVNTWLATGDEGGTSNLYYAFRLVHLPVGLVGVAVGTAVLAEASRRAARRDAEGVRRTLGEAQLVTLAFAAPACAGLIALGEPLAHMLYDWNNMEDWMVANIGATIRYYAAAVIFYCLVKVTVPVFYARGRIRAPVIASLVAVAANLACALSLYGALKYRGLALAVGCGQAANLAVLLWLLAKEYGTPHRAVYGRILRIALASVVCGLVAWAVAGRMPADRAAGARLARGLVPVLAGGLAYFGAGWILRSRDILSVFRSLDRR